MQITSTNKEHFRAILNTEAIAQFAVEYWEDDLDELVGKTWSAMLATVPSILKKEPDYEGYPILYDVQDDEPLRQYLVFIKVEIQTGSVTSTIIWITMEDKDSLIGMN